MPKIVYPFATELFTKYANLGNIAFLSGATPKRSQLYDNSMEFGAEIEFLESLGLDLLMQIVADGIEIIDFPIWLKMPVTKLSEQVTAGLPNDGVTWAEWKDEHHEIIDLLDGNVLVLGNSFGVNLKGSEIKLIYDENDPEIEILTKNGASEALRAENIT